ncbi:MAG: NAD(P)H-hydrate epimerase, partial [Candidatus Aminicenantes bacterium]|nr:NAD(P)H-hydrate epimerase [Candidatus Aminicenantes bacterium]
MKVLTSAQMKEIDRKTIQDIGIPGPVLMENAGLQVVRALTEIFPKPAGERIVVVAGKGNNGGDGLVVARHLLNKGASPSVLLLSRIEDLQGDAALNARIGRNIGLDIKEVPTLEEWKKHRATLLRATVIVDAVFGTGLTKPAEGLYAAAIEDINLAPGFKIAVDVPSGLSSDSFEIIGPTVKADLTVTLAAPKIAHLFPPAENYVGVLRVADISVPAALLQDPGLTLDLVEKRDVRSFFKKRARDTHKGTYGHLLCVGGSWGKTGAVAMAARAALKLGAGLVTVATAESCLPLVARSMAEFMTEPLAETADKTISAEAAGRVLELLKGKDGLLLGPGLSTNASTAEFVRALLPRVKVPVLIDADG